jgi:hypothetical protein
VDIIRERSPEAAEAQLERFITQRHEKRIKSEGERAAEEMYAESVRRFQERQRQENRARWYSFHVDMSELHNRLAAEHQEKAEKLCDESETTKGAA